MKIRQNYQLWKEKAQNSEIMSELASISDDTEQINDRFYKDLEFGTGGLRGVIAAGSNRMNIYTVRRATQGLADFLNGSGGHRSVCIAYDTRHKSKEFAETAAEVLCANGIMTYLFDTVHPTPMLSFAVRYLKAGAGIVITASHNPREYNGYKVYNADGGQITDAFAGEIQRHIMACDMWSGVKTMTLEKAAGQGLFSYIGDGVDAAYFDNVHSIIMRRSLIHEHGKELKIIYSPLHGTGNIPVRRILSEAGFSNVRVVPEQELPDGDFPTTPYPNPEEPSVFSLAVELAKEEEPDLIFATDPDCDRIGVLTKDESGNYVVLTGNQTGALLCDYIIRTNRELGTMSEAPAVIKTIVTTDIVKRICSKYDIAVFEVLTGFKYIGELAEKWQQDGGHSFLFGFEESYGFLAGNFVRDKDAVIASILIAEMALYYKNIGLTLCQALDRLFAEYGYFKEKLISVALPGEEGQKKCESIISNLRQNYQKLLAGASLSIFEDYQQQVRQYVDSGEEEPLLLPKSNVLKFIFTDGGWFVVRPSGTEPKIKVYISTSAASDGEAERRLHAMEEMARMILA